MVAGLALFSAGCSTGPGHPVELRVEPGAVSTRIRLVPAPGWRINALLPPAFERAGGSVIRLAAGRVSADSAYYVEPPAATLPGVHRTLRGTIRASICAEGEQVCRPYVAQF
ncbi:MAG: hypothetical protein ACREOF_16950 [Gemmatimonadales bacterium]